VIKTGKLFSDERLYNFVLKPTYLLTMRIDRRKNIYQNFRRLVRMKMELFCDDEVELRRTVPPNAPLPNRALPAPSWIFT